MSDDVGLGFGVGDVKLCDGPGEVNSAGGLGDGAGLGFGGGVKLCEGPGEVDITCCSVASFFNRIYEERIRSR